MSVAYYIVAEREVEGLDLFVNGKALAHCKNLDELARRAGVRPLISFLNVNDDPLGLSDEDDLDSEGEPSSENAAPVEWFEAEDGLATVRGLIRVLSEDLPEGDLPTEPPASPRRQRVWTPTSGEILEDLKEFEEVLGRLVAVGVRWNLCVDL